MRLLDHPTVRADPPRPAAMKMKPYRDDGSTKTKTKAGTVRRAGGGAAHAPKRPFLDGGDELAPCRGRQHLTDKRYNIRIERSHTPCLVVCAVRRVRMCGAKDKARGHSFSRAPKNRVCGKTNCVFLCVIYEKVYETSVLNSGVRYLYHTKTK